MFHIVEPVTISDQLIGFWSRDLKTEMFGKPGNVSFDRLVQDFCLYTVLFRQIPIQHHLNSTDGENPFLNFHYLS